MPTAARLVSAICLMVVAYFLSGMVKPLMPESTDFGWFVEVNMFLGLCIGWIIMGKRVGRGVTAGINNGLTGVFMLFLWGIGVQSINEMIRLSMRRRYDGPFEAILAVFQIGAEWAVMIATMPILITSVIAATVIGLIAEAAGKRWS